MARRLERVRAFLRELAAAAPTLPEELRRAWTLLYAETQERGLLSVALLLAVFAALGFGLEWLYWWAGTGIRTRFLARRFETKGERLRTEQGLRECFIRHQRLQCDMAQPSGQAAGRTKASVAQRPVTEQDVVDHTGFPLSGRH